jgi:sRNA-binding protein
VLAKLAEIEATLFGGDALPLKRGIFQDLMVAHPGVFDKDELKSALALYTRSTRYLIALASGQQRHDLSGQPVEAVAPEHRYHALVETFRRRHARTGEDVRQKLYERILQAAEDSLLAPGDYATQMRSKDEAANEILDAAMAELGSRVAREEALLRAFDASGQSVNGFADAYGLHPIEAAATLTRARNRAAAIAQAAAAAEAQAAAEAEAQQAEETTEAAAAETDAGDTAAAADTTAPEQAAPSAA